MPATASETTIAIAAVRRAADMGDPLGGSVLHHWNTPGPRRITRSTRADPCHHREGELVAPRPRDRAAARSGDDPRAVAAPGRGGRAPVGRARARRGGAH